MEGNVEVILNHLENREKCVHSLVLCLTSSILRLKHHDDCMSFRRKLEALGVIFKIESAKKGKDFENLEGVEQVLDMCLDVMYGFSNGKDLCIPVVCDILCTSFSLLSPNQIGEKISSVVNKCKNQLKNLIDSPSLKCVDSFNSSIEVTKLGVNLRLCESVIVFLLSWKDKSSSVVERKSHVNVIKLFDDEFVELLLKIVNFEYDVLTSQVLLCLIPKLMILTESRTAVEKLWENITYKFYCIKQESKVTPHMFLIMCALCGHFVPCGFDVPYSFPIGQNYEFWRIVQYGLVSCDSLMRKQALYLLKRAVECESMLSVLPHRLSKSLFWWDQQNSQQCLKIWNEVFLLLEVLEEKQMHLIEPVQPVIVFLFKACQKSLIHPSWILCIILRALRHESNAVVKWGIVCFTELDINLYMDDNTDYSFILPSLLNALNCSSLYFTSSQKLSVPDVVQRLMTFFKMVAEIRPKGFFRSLLNSLIQISWGPVALFYVVYALSGVPKCPVWDTTDIKVLKRFLIDALATQVVHIRGAIQSFFIDTLINLVDEEHMDVATLADIMGSFKKTESFRRGSGVWHKVTTWLKSFVRKEDAYFFAKKSLVAIANCELKCEKRGAARMIVLLSDAELICLDYNDLHSTYGLGGGLLSLVECFQNCHERMYVSHEKQNSCLEMLIHLLEESLPVEENDSTGKRIISLILMILPGIVYCTKRQLHIADNLKCFDTIGLYLHSLNVLSKEPRLCFDLMECAQVIQDASFFFINSDSEEITPISKYFSVKVLCWISDLMNKHCIKERRLQGMRSCVLYERQIAFSENLLRGKNLNRVLMKAKQDKLLTRDLQTLWGRMVSEHMQGIWLLILFYIEDETNLSTFNIDYLFAQHLLKEAVEALEVGGRGMMIPVMTVLERIMPTLLNNNTKDDIKRFISMCWSGVFELHKSDLFWQSMEKFIKMAFQKCLMSTEEMNETLLSYAQKIFIQGETVTGLCNLLLQQLQVISKHYNFALFQPFPEILVNSLLFGPVHRRDRKIDDETCAFIRSLGDRCCINDVCDVYSDSQGRAIAIALLLSSQECVVTRVLHLLLHRDLQMSQQRTHYFSDSQHHRQRNRIMQAFLLLEPVLPKEQCDKLTSYLCNSLLKENHQPSIRYLQEWLLIRLMYRNPNSQSQIWMVLQRYPTRLTA